MSTLAAARGATTPGAAKYVLQGRNGVRDESGTSLTPVSCPSVPSSGRWVLGLLGGRADLEELERRPVDDVLHHLLVDDRQVGPERLAGDRPQPIHRLSRREERVI